MELNGFYNYAAVKLLSLPQASARKLINPNPKVLQVLSQRTLLRAPVRASLSLYVPVHVTHANGSPLSINQNLSAKLSRLPETAIKTLNE